MQAIAAKFPLRGGTSGLSLTSSLEDLGTIGFSVALQILPIRYS